MRVIAGKAKGARLVTVEGLSVRPTTDRIKETLFNILAPDLYGCVFLDLFCGSGAIGIEALSRGAEKAYFVDRDKRSISCVRENLRHTHLEDNACLMRMDAAAAVRSLNQQKVHADIIFMDPPYGKGLEKEVLLALSDASSLADTETMIIVEESLDTDLSYLSSGGYSRIRTKAYKTNQHIFVRKT